MDIREVLSSQKNERDAMLANSYISRENLGSLKAALAHDLIKVIVRPPQGGKVRFCDRGTQRTGFRLPQLR